MKNSKKCFYKILLTFIFVFSIFGISSIKLKAQTTTTSFLYMPYTLDWEDSNERIMWTIGPDKIQEEYIYLFRSNGLDFTNMYLLDNNNVLELHYVNLITFNDIVVFKGNISPKFLYTFSDENIYGITGYWLNEEYNLLQLYVGSLHPYMSSNLYELYGLNEAFLNNNSSLYNLEFNNLFFDNIEFDNIDEYLGNYFYGLFSFDNQFYNLLFFSYDEIESKYYLNFSYNDIDYRRIELNESNITFLQDNFSVQRGYYTFINLDLNSVLVMRSYQNDVKNWSGFFLPIIDIPLYYMYSTFNLDFFGINLWVALTSVLTLAFVLWIIKRLT